MVRYTVKNIRISAYILWRVFYILTEPVPYMFVSVIRNVGLELHYSVDYGYKCIWNRFH